MSNEWDSSTKEAQLNAHEAKFGPPMSAGEVAAHFGEAPPVPNPEEALPSTPEEVKAWEKKQDESNDIYKVAARVKNLARESGAGLTPVGEMLCNTYVHVLLDLYRYAESIKDDRLIALIRKHEKMPADLIAASGIKRKK